MTTQDKQPNRDTNMTDKSLTEVSFETRLLYQRIAEMNTGETLTYEEMEALIDRNPRPGCKGYSNLYAARRMAENNERIVTCAVQNIGIKRLDDSQIANTGKTAISHISRSCYRAAKRLTCANFDALSNDDRITHNASLSMLGAIRQASNAAAVKRVESAAREQNDQLTVGRVLELFK